MGAGGSIDTNFNFNNCSINNNTANTDTAANGNNTTISYDKDNNNTSLKNTNNSVKIVVENFLDRGINNVIQQRTSPEFKLSIERQMSLPMLKREKEARENIANYGAKNDSNNGNENSNKSGKNGVRHVNNSSWNSNNSSTRGDYTVSVRNISSTNSLRPLKVRHNSIRAMSLRNRSRQVNSYNIQNELTSSLVNLHKETYKGDSLARTTERIDSILSSQDANSQYFSKLEEKDNNGIRNVQSIRITSQSTSSILSSVRNTTNDISTYKSNNTANNNFRNNAHKINNLTVNTADNTAASACIATTVVVPIPTKSNFLNKRPPALKLSIQDDSDWIQVRFLI